MIQCPENALSGKKVILSLGGSLVVPDEVDTAYLRNFRDFIEAKVEQGWQFIVVVGGGAPARRYINAASEVMGTKITKDDMDWLGVHATRFNAHLVRTIFRDIAQPAIITDPVEDEMDRRFPVIVASGWKPGWSTDFVATRIAQRLDAHLVVNLSNIKQVYTADPKKDPDAQPIERMTWVDFRKIVGDEWTPGMNTPFDPIAARTSHEHDISVIVTNGTNLDNLGACLEGNEFVGTLLSNEVAQ